MAINDILFSSGSSGESIIGEIVSGSLNSINDILLNRSNSLTEFPSGSRNSINDMEFLYFELILEEPEVGNNVAY